MMYVGMIETRSLQILLKSFHENYSDPFKKTHGNYIKKQGAKKLIKFLTILQLLIKMPRFIRVVWGTIFCLKNERRQTL